MRIKVFSLLITFLLLYRADGSNPQQGYLNITSSVPMLVSLNDSLEMETPAEVIALPEGAYILYANPLNDRNWYSRSFKKMVEVTAGDTTDVYLESKTHRLIQSTPSEALLLTAQDSVLGKTPYILDYNDAFIFLYLEKNGYLRKRLDVTEPGWPKRVTLQRDNDLRQAINIPTHIERPSLFKRYLKPGLVVTAITTNWLSFYLKRKADDYYDKYQSSSEVSRINHYYDKTEQFDMYSSVLLGVSTAATASFLYLLLTD